MEQKSFHSNRKSVDRLVYEAYIKHERRGTFYVILLIIPFYYALIVSSTEQHLTFAAGEVAKKSNILIETMFFNYQEAHQKIISSLIDDLSLSKLFVTDKYISEGLFCYEKNKYEYCLNPTHQTFSMSFNWAGNEYFINGAVKNVKYSPIILCIFFQLIIFIYFALPKNSKTVVREIHNDIIVPLKKISTGIMNNENSNNIKAREVYSIFLDIQKLKELERDKILMEVAININHELKKPLNDLMLLNSRAERALRTQNFNLASDIIKTTADFLNNHQSNVAKIISNFSKVDNKEIFLLSDIPRLDIEPLSETIYLEGNKTLINILFENIYLNAAEAKDPHPKTTISIENTSVKIEICNFYYSFVDTTNIFDSGFTTKKSGHGIGLSTCKKIVEIHDGNIFAKYVDNKFSISIFLPIKEVPL